MTRAKNLLRATVASLLLFTLLLGVAYPLAITAVAQLLFPNKANGSLIVQDGKVVGSSLLGQEFTGAKYFWSRPSATTPPYNASGSGGSNLNPGNPAQLEAVKARVAALKKLDPKNTQAIPVDLVTASASGLDPHISVAAAEYQLPRVARARGMKEEDLRALVAAHTEDGLIGEPVVNVLELNLALDAKR